VKVVITGDGGDELFAGYEKWMTYLRLQDAIVPLANRLPSSVRNALWASSRVVVRSEAKRDILARILDRQELFVGGTLLKHEALEVLLRASATSNGNMEAASRAAASMKEEFNAMGGSREYADWMTYWSLKSGLLEDFLMRLDKMGMATSVKARAPMLDHEFVEFACSIPARLKYPGYEPKVLLKRAAADVVPRDLVYRRKQGFCTPLEGWLRSDLADALDDVFSSPAIDALFDASLLRERLDSFKSGEVGGHSMYGLMNFLLWYEHWF
jgi:asparagine synthase (glutamine-hydrolysing)